MKNKKWHHPIGRIDNDSEEEEEEEALEVGEASDQDGSQPEGDEQEAEEPTSDYQEDDQGNEGQAEEDEDELGTPPMPPSGIQNYNPQGADVEDSQPFFQYSQCTGKKKGLFIGINYIGHEQGELHGCINDVHNIREFVMESFGYEMKNIVTLTDDEENPVQRPTRDNIIQAMHWLVSDAQPNDSLFLHYSGHGGQQEDPDGDEGDGFDETLCPEDYETTGMILDDELHDILVKPLPPGCRLTAIFDCCHSGSVLDLPFIYSTEGKLKGPNLAAEAGQGLLQAVTSYAKGDMGGVLRSAIGFVKTATGTIKADKLSKATKTSPADCISFSGCKDNQTSTDAQQDGEATGAMSYAFISALKATPHQSYQQLLVNIRNILQQNNYEQKPQLSASHPIDTKLMFII